MHALGSRSHLRREWNTRNRSPTLGAVGAGRRLASSPRLPSITLRFAKFVYLLLHNEKIRDVIDTIGKKGVLLLGRFTEGRMVVLERLREKFRNLDYVPMVFNYVPRP